LGKALHILQIIASMARESVEGQAMELDWIHRHEWNLRDRDYCLMCYKKSCWYTFIAPMQIGAVVSGASVRQLALLRKYAAYIGIAFQIQDDVLNLVADEQRYGKEIAGDLWEGKHTLILLHMLRTAPPEDASHARTLLAKARQEKTETDIAELLDLVKSCGSIEYARQVAQRMARKTQKLMEQASDWMPPSVHRDFLSGMVEYVIERDR
jgi:geranylgeranyl diphosphate synthase type II